MNEMDKIKTMDEMDETTKLWMGKEKQEEGEEQRTVIPRIHTKGVMEEKE